MRISHFFIDRPIFAAVVSIVFVIVGGVSFSRLPIAQYPEIAPPTINVTGQYPGASSDVVAQTVVTPIEEQINGVENMIYMYSNSNADGVGSITVFGSRAYSMRVWLDPDRLQSVGLTASDVVTALQGQNVQVASGALNQPPMDQPGAFQIAVQTLGRLDNPGEFSNVV